MAMMAGKLDKRITLQSQTETADGGGGFTVVWTDEITVWASISSPGARDIERLQAMKQQSEISHKVIIRYREGVSTAWRVKFGTRYFNIAAITNPEEKNESLEMMCNEVSA
jgi:SPP1 family predicted phage head-tail adaptor